jgi:hypothetical protein
MGYGKTNSNILNLSNELIFEVVKKQQDQIIELTNTIKELIPKLGNTTITTKSKFITANVTTFNTI